MEIIVFGKRQNSFDSPWLDAKDNLKFLPKKLVYYNEATIIFIAHSVCK